MKGFYQHLKGRQVDIIGNCIYHGNLFSGTQHGPNTIRQGGLFRLFEKYGWRCHDKGNITYQSIDKQRIDSILKSRDYFNARNDKLLGDALVIGAMNEMHYNVVKDSAHKGNLVLSLGGDHSIASGSIPALKEVYPNLKVVWVDAHADINTPETSHSIHYHGMPAAHCLGLIKPGEVPGFEWLSPNLGFKDIVYIGLRSIDEGEVDFLRKYNIKHYDMDAVTELGIGNVLKETLEYFREDQQSDDYPIHISFDIDGADEQYVKQTGTVCRGGLTDRESQYIIRKLVSTKNVVSMDLVELNPELGSEKDKTIRQHYHGDLPEIIGTPTTCFSLDLVRCLLGDRLCI